MTLNGLLALKESEMVKPLVLSFQINDILIQWELILNNWNTIPESVIFHVNP